MLLSRPISPRRKEVGKFVQNWKRINKMRTRVAIVDEILKYFDDGVQVFVVVIQAFAICEREYESGSIAFRVQVGFVRAMKCVADVTNGFEILDRFISSDS